MGDLTPTQLLIIGGIVVVVAGLAIFGLRRGLRRASVEGYGVRADLEGAEPEKPLSDQEMQTHDFTSKSSFFKISRGARTSFSRSRFKNSVVQIVSDETPAGQTSGDQRPGLSNPAVQPNLTAPPNPTGTHDTAPRPEAP